MCKYVDYGKTECKSDGQEYRLLSCPEYYSGNRYTSTYSAHALDVNDYEVICFWDFDNCDIDGLDLDDIDWDKCERINEVD